MESQKLKNKSQYTRTTTSKSDTAASNVKFYYPKITDSYNKTPFSINIQESSIFSSNYDVDSYLRRNLNFKGIMGKSTSVDDFRIATDNVSSRLDKPLLQESPNYYNKHSNNFEPNKRLEKETPKNLSSPQNRINNNNFEEYKDNKKIDSETNLRVKNNSPITKGNKVQYKFDNNNDYDNDIDDIISGNDKYIVSKDIVIHDKDSDVVVKRRNTNFQIVGDDDISDSLDVQVKGRTDKYSMANDKNKNYATRHSDKGPISRVENDKYPITTDNKKKYENSKFGLSGKKNDKLTPSNMSPITDIGKKKNGEFTLSNDKNDKQIISRDKNDMSRITSDNENYTPSKGKKDKNSKYIEPGKKIGNIDHSVITDVLPIPVLRHSPKIQINEENNTNLSDAMKVVEDKWKVPAVQKNILKNVNDDGKNVSILTQLGSIRRQLQLEQLKLDKMLTKDDV